MNFTSLKSLYVYVLNRQKQTDKSAFFQNLKLKINPHNTHYSLSQVAEWISYRRHHLVNLQRVMDNL